MRRCEVARICGAVLFGCLLPAMASAQSTIAGLVTDATGGVLPGVTVEAASPALIERVRSVATDAEGRYSIIDIRPGTYTVTFTLTGFSSVRREGIEVESNVNVPINAELRVGAVEETITVSGATPVVDIQSVARHETMTREQTETLPTTRQPNQMLALVPGAKVTITNGRSGVQGATEVVFVTGRGLTMYETRWNIDGMDARPGNLSGLNIIYMNDAMAEETVFTTFGSSIESPTGGVSLNIIPRDGGNRYSGNFFFSGNPKAWVGDNLSQELIDIGFTAGTTLGTNGDRSVTGGGPIKRDRLWFYGGWRQNFSNQFQADQYDSEPGVRDETNWFVANPLPNWKQQEEKTDIHNFSGRLTAQLTQGQKITAYYDRPFAKDFFSDPRSWASDRWHMENYVAQLKYTNTVSSKFLLDVGHSQVALNRTRKVLPPYNYPRFSTGWYNTAPREDLTTGRELGALIGTTDMRYGWRNTFSANANYITGSHTVKVGTTIGNNWDEDWTDFNGDLTQLYRNGVPDSVRVANTPSRNLNRINLEYGVYAGDTWSLKRLTLTGGMRFDHWDAAIPDYGIPAGRFVKLRHQPEVKAPIQNNTSGRIGVTYDLFGNAKTALKGSFGKYLANVGVVNLRAINPQLLTTTTLTWVDSNNDKIAQDNELENIAIVNPNFFNNTPIPQSFDPEWKREYNYASSFGVQHQLIPGFGVNAIYFHTKRQNLQYIDRTLISQTDYFPYSVTTPGGEVVTIYNLPDNLRAVYTSSPQVLRTETNSDVRRVEYDGIEFSFDGRLPWGTRAFGGWTIDRENTISCADERDNPNLRRFCDTVVPFSSEYKLSLMQRLPWAIDASVTVNSLAGRFKPQTWTVSRTLRYAADCKQPCRPGDLVVTGPLLNGPAVALAVVEPGTLRYDRYQDIGIGISKVFQLPKGRLRAGFNIFNSLNSGIVITEGTNIAAPAAFGRPTFTQEPRVIQGQIRYTF